MGEPEKAVEPVETPVERLWKALEMAGVSWGSTYRTITLQRWAGIPERPDGMYTKDEALEWARTIQAIKERLLTQNQMHLYSTGSGTYRVAEPNEQAALAASRLHRDYLKAGRTASTVSRNTNVGLLTEYERKSHEETCEHIESVRRFVKRASRVLPTPMPGDDE